MGYRIKKRVFKRQNMNEEDLKNIHCHKPSGNAIEIALRFHLISFRRLILKWPNGCWRKGTHLF